MDTLLPYSPDDTALDAVIDATHDNKTANTPAPSTAPTANGLRAWLTVINATLSAVEDTVWQGRALAEQALQAYRAIESGAEDAAEQYQQLTDEARRWPARLQRLSATGWMLTRVAARYRLWSLRSAFISRSKMPQALDKMHRKSARNFRDISLQHGGAFLKIGQLLSSRPDILPQAWIDELASLQDQASKAPYDSMRAVIEEEFGKSVDDLFSQFNHEPIAAASIGQVYRARLHDGRDVAVKVQRPGLEEVIELDMTLLKIFAESLRGMLPPTDLDTIVSEIQRSVREELDYRVEARWMQRISDLLDPVDKVRVPKPIKRFCGKHVLVSEFVEGRKLTDVLDEMQRNNDQEGLADVLGRLLDMYLRQILQAGYFQADPHPGNIMVGDDGTLILLDFGCTAELPESFRKGYFDILLASVIGDTEKVARVLGELGFKTRSGKPDTLLAFNDAILQQLRNMLSEIDEKGFVWPSPDDLLEKAKALFDQANSDPVEKLPPEFIMLARVFGTLGGMFLHYQPRIDVTRYLLPYMMITPE